MGMRASAMRETALSELPVLTRYYPANNESCAPAGVPVLSSGNFTNMTLTDCGLNFSTTYWALVYIEGAARRWQG